MLSLSIVHLLTLFMRFQIPGRDVHVRLFERVGTSDAQYDIFDVGLEQADGTIDSIAVGGSFSYAKSLIKKANEAKDAKPVEDPMIAVVPDPTPAPTAA